MRRRDFLATLAAAVGCVAVPAHKVTIANVGKTDLVLRTISTAERIDCKAGPHARLIVKGDFVRYWDAEKKQFGPCIPV